MKTSLAVGLLLLSSAVRAQSPAESGLESTCLPTAPLTTLRAVIQVESNGNPNAMQVDFPKVLLQRWKLPEGTLRLKRQPTNQQEALDWLAVFQTNAIVTVHGVLSHRM